MRTRSKAALLAAPALLLTAALGGAGPTPQPATEAKPLDQGWQESVRLWFYHESQGTRALPMAWFLALERPGGGPNELLAHPDNLARFGFLPDAESPWNPRGLPVGFAEDGSAREVRSDGREDRPEPAMGLTCAACHTGQVEYRGAKLRIDGGPAIVDVTAFLGEVTRALVATAGDDDRFDRFAARVNQELRRLDTAEERKELRRRLAARAAEARQAAELERTLSPVAEGPGRLDALGRGANFIFFFSATTRDPRNLGPADAPVSYPALWDTPWFRWPEYNGSISQPMARNVSEALGVRAFVRLTREEETRYASSVRMDALYAMESFLAGDGPDLARKHPEKRGLHAPPWPEEQMGRIDRAKADRGRTHYELLCAGCHQERLSTSPLGRPELLLTMVDLPTIGTDSKVATNFAERIVHLPWEGGGAVPAGEALRKVTNGVMNRWYAENGTAGEPVGPEERWRMSGQSENEWRAPLAYRARPLNGVWATAPYLHNGSVPNLYELLLPAERRSKEFRVGGREFDPVRVGFDKDKGDFRFDTSLPGNSNRGHEFRDGPRGDGVIGPALSEKERWELIEYLKTQ